MQNFHRLTAPFGNNGHRVIYIVGGRAKRDARTRSEWDGYRSGLILRRDGRTGDVETCVEYVTLDTARPADQYACLFKSATVVGDEMYACTQTEVLIYRLPEFRRTGYRTLPCFNDLHHVRPAANGNLLVVNTGLDMVLELSRYGTICREWGLADEDCPV